MSPEPDRSSDEATEISWSEMLWRLSWIGTRIILIFAFADEFQPFFYQAF